MGVMYTMLKNALCNKCKIQEWTVWNIVIIMFCPFTALNSVTKQQKKILRNFSFSIFQLDRVGSVDNNLWGIAPQICLKKKTKKNNMTRDIWHMTHEHSHKMSAP